MNGGSFTAGGDGAGPEPDRLVDILTRQPAEALAAFVRTWHGVELADEPPPGRLPIAIRRLIDAQRETGRLFVQNWLEDDPDGRPSDHGRRAFYIENQNNQEWAIDVEAGDDAPVWVNHDADLGRWTLEVEPLSTFLLQAVVFEALVGAMASGLGGPEGGRHCSFAASRDLTTEELVGLTAGLHLLPWAPWRWPAEHTWFYAGARVIATVSASGPDGHRGPDSGFALEVASHRPDGLDELAVSHGEGSPWRTWWPGAA